MKKLFENWNKFINEMEVSGGNLPADHSARQGQKTNVEVLLDDIEKASVYDDEDPFSAVRMLLLKAIERILTTPYDEKDPNSPLVYKDEIPEVLEKMADLIMDRDYETIHSDFNKMWTELVSYHRDNKKTVGGLTPRVSHNFRSIGTTIRSLR